eukprot:6227857-Amphidinium_carterae.1
MGYRLDRRVLSHAELRQAARMTVPQGPPHPGAVVAPLRTTQKRQATSKLLLGRVNLLLSDHEAAVLLVAWRVQMPKDGAGEDAPVTLHK